MNAGVDLIEDILNLVNFVLDEVKGRYLDKCVEKLRWVWAYF